jgi:peptidase MA superfamily protein
MKVRSVAWLAVAFAGLSSGAASWAEADVAERAQALIAGLDCDEARGELASADPEDLGVAVERARLAIYELDCDGALAILGRPELQKSESGQQLADIARGCQRVTAALAVDRDELRGIEVRWQDEHDRPLAPLLFDTVAKARVALTRDLGVDWPRPTRVVVVRDLLSLAAMTGLPYKSAQTTGTVAVAKWGRVTLLSPRASRDGYAWRDTVAHELTHLAVTRLTRDRAPLWLQEGVAKREEVRWREPGPFDDRPSADAVVLRGQKQRLDIALDKLGPSIAMLPSADAATVAFAEVTSFVRFYVQMEGDDALAKLLAELRAGKDPDQALVAASGTDLRGWDGKWRAYVASISREPLPTLFELGGERRDVEKWRQLRERSRLAELLLARGHAAEAVDELNRVAAPGASADPSVRWLRARALEEAGRQKEGEPLVADPKQVLSSYGPWWAVRGRWARLRGDEEVAVASFIEAVAADPFDLEAACEAIDPTLAPQGADKGPLCDAARANSEEPFGD